MRVKRHQQHQGDLVRVGPFEVLAGGLMYFSPDEDLPKSDLVVLLTEETYEIGGWCDERNVRFIHHPVEDCGIPEKDSWVNLLREIIQELRNGRQVSVYCEGGHGRTGMFLASLVTLLEPEVEDSVQAVRERYCEEAVDTHQQAAFVRSLN